MLDLASEGEVVYERTYDAGDVGASPGERRVEDLAVRGLGAIWVQAQVLVTSNAVVARGVQHGDAHKTKLETPSVLL